MTNYKVHFIDCSFKCNSDESEIPIDAMRLGARTHNVGAATFTDRCEILI